MPQVDDEHNAVADAAVGISVISAAAAAANAVHIRIIKQQRPPLLVHPALTTDRQTKRRFNRQHQRHLQPKFYVGWATMSANAAVNWQAREIGGTEYAITERQRTQEVSGQWAHAAVAAVELTIFLRQKITRGLRFQCSANSP